MPYVTLFECIDSLKGGIIGIKYKYSNMIWIFLMGIENPFVSIQTLRINHHFVLNAKNMPNLNVDCYWILRKLLEKFVSFTRQVSFATLSSCTLRHGKNSQLNLGQENFISVDLNPVILDFRYAINVCTKRSNMNTIHCYK